MKFYTHIIKVGLMLPLFLFRPAHAQNENFGFNVTAQGGVGFSYAGPDQQERKSFKLSPDAGLRFKLDLTKHFGVTIGVSYTQKAKYYSYTEKSSFFTDLSNSFLGFLGEDLDSVIYDAIGTTADFVNDTIYSHYSARVNIHYLQVPIMASFDIKNFSISAGGYLGFKLGASATQTLKQDFPLYNTFEPALTDSSLALVAGLFTAAYPAIKEPVVSELQDIEFVNALDYGLMAEISARFDQRFSMYMNASYGLKDYSNDPVKYPGKHFSVSFGMGATFGKIKGANVTPKFF